MPDDVCISIQECLQKYVSKNKLEDEDSHSYPA